MTSHEDPVANGPGSETIHRDIAPRYKFDSEDIEKNGDHIPSEAKVAETSSVESPRKIGTAQDNHAEDDEYYEPGVITRYWRKYRPFGHAILWLLVTAYCYCRRN